MTHEHCHDDCKHEDMKYCAKCEVPYCADCWREWHEYRLDDWNPYYQHIKLDTTANVPWNVSNTSSNIDAFKYSGAIACSHN